MCHKQQQGNSLTRTHPWGQVCLFLLLLLLLMGVAGGVGRGVCCVLRVCLLMQLLLVGEPWDAVVGVSQHQLPACPAADHCNVAVEETCPKAGGGPERVTRGTPYQLTIDS
jgi:hypothetical protein